MKILPVFILGTQSTLVTNVYINFVITLLAMVLFALFLFQVLFKIGHFSVLFHTFSWRRTWNIFRSITGFIQLVMDPESF